MRDKSRLYWWLPAILAIALLSACGGAQDRYKSHLDRGKQYLADGNLVKASLEFRNALQIQPKSAEAQYLAGQVAERSNNFRGAMGAYLAAIEVGPDFLPPYASLGRLYVFASAPEHAIALIEPMLVKHPGDATLLTVRGAARLQLKDEGGARADAERAVQLAPSDTNAIALLAAVYQRGGDNARAIALLSDSVGKMPDAVDLRGILANLYMLGDQPQKAEEQLRKLVQLRPGDLSLRYQLALFYTRNHQLDQAQQVLTDAVRAAPASDEAKFQLVSFLLAQRSRADAQKALRGFIDDAPKDYDLRLGLGQMLHDAGDDEAAQAAYADIIRLDGTGPKGLQARNRIAALQAAKGNYDAALKLADEVLSHNARDTDALTLRGEVELLRGGATAAIADLRAVLRDHPESIAVRRTLARAYVANSQPQLAEETLRAAMDAAPQDPAVRVQLASLLMQTDRADPAVTLLEETVRRAPTDPEAREALVRAYLMKHDLPQAAKAAEDLTTLRPQASPGFYLAGVVAQVQGRLDDSEKAYRRALELQPSAIDALSALARLQLSRGHAAQALATVQQAVARDQQSPWPLNLLGEMYLAQGDAAHAKQALQAASTLAPKWWQPQRNLALADVLAGDVPGAVTAYASAISLAPADLQLTTELARLYEREGRIDDAIASYDSFLKGNPSSPLAASELATLLATYKTDPASLDRAQKLTAGFAGSDNGMLLDAGGWVQFKRGDYANALNVLERASQRAPDSRVVRYHLAMAQLQAGDRDKARGNLEAALAGSGSFAGATEARSALASLKSGAG